MTLDDEFADLARRVPGFGGLFYDSSGALVVYLTDPAGASAVSDDIRAFLARKRQENPEVQARAQREVAAMRVLRGDYDFAQLLDWYQRLIAAAPAQSLTFGDIDESRNRILIGVAAEGFVGLMQSGISEVDVPRDAVVLELRGSVPVLQTLSSVVRPVPAAVQVGRRVGNDSACTLTFNAYYSDNSGLVDGYKYFVTNSHCTGGVGSFGVVNGAQFGQPDINSLIGSEVADPPLFDNATNSMCQLGYQCRYSDAALMRYGSGISWRHGQVPNVVRLFGAYWINGWMNVKNMGDNWDLYMGLAIEKTGWRTGRTTGTVTGTCQGALSDYGVYLLCQGVSATMGAGGGDSGSPVYRRDPQNNVDPLIGFLWGGFATGPTYFSRVYYGIVELRNAFGGAGNGWLWPQYNICPSCGY